MTGKIRNRLLAALAALLATIGTAEGLEILPDAPPAFTTKEQRERFAADHGLNGVVPIADAFVMVAMGKASWTDFKGRLLVTNLSFGFAAVQKADPVIVFASVLPRGALPQPLVMQMAVMPLQRHTYAEGTLLAHQYFQVVDVVKTRQANGFDVMLPILREME